MERLTYHKPGSLADAKSLLSSSGEAKLLAGGQTLIPTMKQRLATPSDVINISELPELKGISNSWKTLEIGAGETHADVAASKIVGKHIPALADLAAHIGDPHVRHKGTLGGSVSNNDPAACYPSALLALGATVHTDRREIKAEDFFTGMFETALSEDEIVTKVTFPKPKKAAYIKFRNPASRYAVVGVFVAQMDRKTTRMAITGAAPSVFRASAIEHALSKKFAESSVPDNSVAPDKLLSDIHASADYRAALITVMAKQAVVKAG